MRKQPVQVERAGARLLRVRAQSFAAILELVVIFQGMRSHGHVAGLNMRGQHECDGRRIAVLFAPSFKREAHGVGCGTSRASASRMASCSAAAP